MSELDATASRILDANVNRAREAFRVMEEYARFALEDAGLCAAIKEARHALAQAAAGFCGQGASAGEPTPGQAGSGGELIARRDIQADVGRDVRTASEYVRTDMSHVVTAAAKRLTEALRVIEEYGKLSNPTVAGWIEALRYEAYELERRLHMTFRARVRFADVRLYVIITEALCREDWLATAKAALIGGADCLQLREKDVPARELLERSKQLAPLCHEHGALCIMNDRPDIAAAAGADGVHLGQDDLPVTAARRLLPATAIVGVSTHTHEQVRQAARECPDYIAVGSIFETQTKSRARVAGPATLREARRSTSLPLVAIGGINEGNAGEVLAACPCCLCVCSAVISQHDVENAARRLRALVDEAWACGDERPGASNDGSHG